MFHKLQIFILLAILPSLAYAEGNIFKEGDHCVAWKTSKKMFLLSNSTPIGMNCKASAEAKKVGADYKLYVTVPVAKFDSGEETRDEEVVLILGGDKQPNIIIESEALSIKKITSLEKKDATLQGSILINGKKFGIPIKVKSTINNGKLTYQGFLKTSFTALGLEPPSVAGGVVAKVYDELELHFQFQEAKIIGHPNL
ncbi:MAG: YceI family protein [Leptospira sp.]|nr:YceI family protein [Leptospira sp.]